MSGRITFGDERLLQQFFGRYQVAFERSTAGATLENASLLGQLRPDGVHANADLRPEQYLKIEQKYPAAPEPRVVDGRVVYSALEITAYPTAETRNEGGYEPDSEVLIRYALVTRRLMQLERQSRTSVQVLEAYFGDRGARCSEPKRDDDGRLVAAVGRLVAVYPITAAGKDLLHESSKKSRLHLTPIARMENIVRQPSAEQKALLAKAERSATAMLHEACERWNTIAGRGQPRTVEQILRKRAQQPRRTQ
jgi:hypothetical protein